MNEGFIKKLFILVFTVIFFSLGYLLLYEFEKAVKKAKFPINASATEYEVQILK